MTKEELRLWDYLVGCALSGYLARGYSDRKPKNVADWANSYALELIDIRRGIKIDE